MSADNDEVVAAVLMVVVVVVVVVRMMTEQSFPGDGLGLGASIIQVRRAVPPLPEPP